MHSATRSSLHPTRSPTKHPKLNPATSNGVNRKFRRQKIERRCNVAALAATAIMRACAHPGAAKIESQNRQAERIERFRRLISGFVVHRAAKERMWMAHDRRDGRTHFTFGLPENRLEPTFRPLQE